MKLNWSTPCSDIEIRMPRWKDRVVGIASYKVGNHNKVRITAKGKDGERYYPNDMYISGEEVTKCEKQTLPSGVVLYLVPISKLEALEEIR
jgi:hypothetical protein